MSFKAIFVGFLLAAFISGFTYFNDAVMRNTFLIGNFFPIGVFGPALLLLLAVNPLLRACNRNWSLRPAEFAVAIALGLAACGWPGSNFYRTAVTISAMPPHLERTHTAWQSQNVMSYVPGGSPLLAQGQVSDWQRLARKIVDTEPAGRSPAARIRELLEPHHVQAFEAAARARMVEPARIDAMTRAVNHVLESPEFYDPAYFEGVETNETARRLLMRDNGDLTDYQTARLNRALLVSAFPDLVRPPPSGQGVLLSFDEDGEAVLDVLLEGRRPDERWSLRELPWRVWWPNIRLWGGMSILLGLASLCMALIVHRQWYRHELLPYPIARFVEEVLVQEKGRKLPAVACQKAFWVAFCLVFGLRLLNGLAAWIDGVPEFPLIYGFGPLRELFPNARRVPWNWGVWEVRIYPTVIAFTFFLNTKVAFSLGIANLAWSVFGAMLLVRGVPVTFEWIGGDLVNMMRFGSFLGIVGMMLYTGRRFYSQVAVGALGFDRDQEVPPYAVWAARGLMLCFILATLLLTTAGLPALWSFLFVFLFLLTVTVLSRVVAETGAFFLQTSWLPVGVLTAMFGVEAIGPTGYIVLGVTSIMLIGDPRTALMPFISTGLRIGEETGQVAPARLSRWLAAVIIGGFIVAGAATFYFQHNEGVNVHDSWAMRALPSMPFTHLARHTADMSAHGVLAETTFKSTAERLFTMFSPSDGAYFWLLTGLALVLITAFARLRLPWWPIHPVLFLVWVTYPIQRFGSTFLVGWAIKAAVVKTMGAKGYHTVKPLMIGLIVGDLFGGLLWIAVGIVYYYFTGLTPVSYPIFPT